MGLDTGFGPWLELGFELGLGRVRGLRPRLRLGLWPARFGPDIGLGPGMSLGMGLGFGFGSTQGSGSGSGSGSGLLEAWLGFGLWFRLGLGLRLGLGPWLERGLELGFGLRRELGPWFRHGVWPGRVGPGVGLDLGPGMGLGLGLGRSNHCNYLVRTSARLFAVIVLHTILLLATSEAVMRISAERAISS